MVVIRQKWIKREDLQNNRDVLYLFGDNFLQKGFGGQAAEMRGEVNAFGIATKKDPNHIETSYFTDEEFDSNKAYIDNSLKSLSNILSLEIYKAVVIPLDGLGTGLADLPNKAPKTYAYLTEKLEDFFNYI